MRDDLTFRFVVSPQWDCLGQGTQIIKPKLPIWPCERAGEGVTRNTMGVWVLEALGEPPVAHWWWHRVLDQYVRGPELNSPVVTKKRKECYLSMLSY